MKLDFPPDQKRWLEAQVATGQFPSLEAAAQAAVSVAMADAAHISADDLAWAKPYIDMARDDVREGRIHSHAEQRRRMDARLAAMKR